MEAKEISTINGQPASQGRTYTRKLVMPATRVIFAQTGGRKITEGAVGLPMYT